jgi:hypothetical protein
VVPAGASFVLSDPHPVIDPSSVSTGAVVVPSPLTATVLSPVVSPRIRQVRDPLIVGNSTDGVHEVT